jgi:hypothetical protein
LERPNGLQSRRSFGIFARIAVELEQTPETLTLVTFNNSSQEISNRDECLQLARFTAADESAPDLPLSASHLYKSRGRLGMIIEMSGTPVVVMDACWTQDKSAAAWDVAEQRFCDAVKKGIANDQGWQPREAPAVPWAAVTIFVNAAPIAIAMRIEAAVKAAVWQQIGNTDQSRSE